MTIKRTEVGYGDLYAAGLGVMLPVEVWDQIEIQIKYEGYIQKQLAQEQI